MFQRDFSLKENFHNNLKNWREKIKKVFSCSSKEKRLKFYLTKCFLSTLRFAFTKSCKGDALIFLAIVFDQ